ncbi:MAG: metallophosphoesterase, partial [bacterium]|nr:metallophosphoesterase [bacterium]
MEGDRGKKTVTWLHLSDLHLCNPKSGWEADYIRDKLREDFDVLQKKYQLRPDLIFFSGDVVYGHLGEDGGKPMARQYRDAAIFFDEVRRSFDPEIPRDRLFFVPGNHDVKRSKGREYLRKGFDAEMPKDEGLAVKRLSELLQKKGDDWTPFIEGMADYLQFLADKGYSHLLEDRERLIYAVIREVNGVNVGIAGLNSAWSSYKNGEKGNLWLGGHWQVQELSRRLKSADIKIAMMHHPFNWFHPTEDPKVKRELQNHFRFFLHGHEHMGWIEVLDEKFIRISAGACYGGSEEEMGYNMMQLDVGTGKCKVWLRKYDEAGGGWGPRFIHGKTDERGIREIGFGAPQKPAKKPAPKLVVQPIEPDSPESRGVFGRGKKIGDIAEILSRTPIMGICGMAGIGKSLIIQEVMRTPRHKEKDYITCFVNTKMGLGELFRQLARVLGCRDEEPKVDFNRMFGGGYDFSILKTYAETTDRPVVIHLVDSHYLFRDYKNWRDEGIRQFLE